jgi:undecaprenyl-diphosphatase
VGTVARTFLAGYVALAAVTLGIGLIVTMSLESSSLSADETIAQWLVDNRVSWLDSLSGVASSLGNTTVIVCGMIGFCVAALSARWWQPAAMLAGGLALELATFLTVSFWLDRPRPDLPVLGSVPSTASFPSGHSAAAVVFYLGLALTAACRIERVALRRAVWTVACIAGFSVGLARAYRAVHHPSDVVAGWAVGIGALIVALYAVSRTASPCDVPESDSSPPSARPAGS